MAVKRNLPWLETTCWIGWLYIYICIRFYSQDEIKRFYRSRSVL